MKDMIQQGMCVLLYALAVYLWAAHGLWYLFAGLFALHFTELLVVGWRVGRQAGKPPLVTIGMTLLCGYTWWLPLQRSLAQGDQGRQVKS